MQGQDNAQPNDFDSTTITAEQHIYNEPDRIVTETITNTLIQKTEGDEFITLSKTEGKD